MSKKSKKRIDATPRFYIHYHPETLQIFSVNNYKQDSDLLPLEVDFQTYENLLFGKDRFEDYKIGPIVDESGVTVIGVTHTNFIINHTLPNGLLSCINQKNDPYHLLVGWNGWQKHWVFSPSVSLINQYYNNELSFREISIFVISKNDPDFLIRTIGVDIRSMMPKKDIIVDFESTWESDIDSITLLTNISLDYSLHIWESHE